MFGNRNKGFTLVELLIVIVVVAVLASITIVAYNGVQARAKDTERQTDMRNLAQQLEIYYQENGYYPLFSQLSNSTWRASNMPNVKDGLLTPPGQSSTVLYNSTSPSVDRYGYYTVNSCVSGQCAKYRLYWRNDADGQLQTHIGATGP